MKKLFTLAIVALSLILTPAVPTQVKAVTYTRYKNKSGKGQGSNQWSGEYKNGICLRFKR